VLDLIVTNESGQRFEPLIVSTEKKHTLAKDTATGLGLATPSKIRAPLERYTLLTLINKECEKKPEFHCPPWPNLFWRGGVKSTRRAITTQRYAAEKYSDRSHRGYQPVANYKFAEADNFAG
jgi:hypothetical protein